MNKASIFKACEQSSEATLLCSQAPQILLVRNILTKDTMNMGPRRATKTSGRMDGSFERVVTGAATVRL